MASSADDLLTRATDGDADALAILLERHGQAVRRTLEGKISARWQSVLSEDDVMQQTYADAFQDIGSFVPQGDGSFVAWLTKIANRNLLDGVKMLEREKRGGKRRRVEARSSDGSYVALYELVGRTSSTPSQHAARDEAKDVLGEAIRKLPTAYREVVRLYDLDGQPVQNVADALGRSCGAVFMLRARAHAHLRELMGAASDYLSGSA
ncbi:MAG: sigma-70 family RNA polymerase sigma factor [Phycisphaerales bacterium]|nr:MAG: sigma-70 family RNA polymerase sigma factor [Phycisphaerales bacterium]